MNKIITGASIMLIISSLAYGDCFNSNYTTGVGLDQIGYDKCEEQVRRSALSPEEQAVEDMEKANKLKERKSRAQKEQDRLDGTDTAWGKAKSFFN